MTTGPKKGWGGKRKGSGRKKTSLSDRNVKALMRSVRKVARERDKPIWDVLVEIAYGDYDASTTNRLSAIKTIGEFTIVRRTESHQTVEDKRAPVVGLPPEQEDPAKVVDLKVVKENKG